MKAEDLLLIWEYARERDPAQLRTVLMGVLRPDLGPVDLEAMSLGRVHQAMIRTLCDMAAAPLRGQATCPACGEVMGFHMDPTRLLIPPEPEALVVEHQDYRLRLRPPSGRDLAMVLALGEETSAWEYLVEACLVSARDSMGPVAPTSLPAEIIALAGEALAEADPGLIYRLSMKCIECGHQWSPQLDPALFLVREAKAAAKRILIEVDRLAKTYGWSEAEILAMSPRRRQTYLDLV